MLQDDRPKERKGISCETSEQDRGNIFLDYLMAVETVKVIIFERFGSEDNP